MAEFYAVSSDYHSAVSYYSKIVDIDPENGPAWTALGHCFLLVDELQKAFTAY